MIRHLVALRFKAGTPEDVKRGLMDDLAKLDERIDGIFDFRACQKSASKIRLCVVTAIFSGSISAMHPCAMPISPTRRTKASELGLSQNSRAVQKACSFSTSKSDAGQ